MTTSTTITALQQNHCVFFLSRLFVRHTRDEANRTLKNTQIEISLNVGTTPLVIPHFSLMNQLMRIRQHSNTQNVLE